MPAPWPESSEESEAKRPRVSDTPLRSKECRRSIQSAGGLSWSSADLTLAATLLETPSARFPSVKFSDLEEKRRVFTLVYDVLRYKSVLNQALNDLYFFTRFPHLKERCHLVWLLFFDLYKRDFSMRDALEPEVAEAFSRQGLHEIDEILWQLRVKLAATVSRLRIKSGAHSLSQLLPKHLRVTRSALEENIITGWVNGFKTSVKETCQQLEDMNITPLSRDREILTALSYKTDHLLPRFMHIMPNLREDLVNSHLICDHHIIMQERTFCLGPAVMAQMLKNYALGGKVAQTHVNSPITMAYFANLLINNDKIEAFLVFGAGYKKEACEQYLQELGVKNTQVFSESFADLPAESRVLDNVIAVLATPPNTNSSVVDPVDLSVTRGGDLEILQQLTDTDFTSTPRGCNIDTYLVEQRDTLRRAMSKPQIQFIVYETHSRYECENEEMANNTVNELNNYAAEVHLEELRRAQGETQERERAQAAESAAAAAAAAAETPANPEVPTIKVDEELALPIPSPTPSVVIPPSDLFEVADPPDLCPNFESCLDLGTEGTYIAVIKRKEITRLDPKYMISMAEARGLFGRPDGTPKTKQSGQTARAKAALAALQAKTDAMNEKSKTKVKVEMDRIAAPTRASLLRDVKPVENKDCPRHTTHQAHDGTPSYRYMVDSIKELKVYLTKQEEEDLIRRLYTNSKLNTFPARLQEELPPLKFWSSPAPVIEAYLQRKVFQRRLQLAYEFNQSKYNNSITSPAEEETETQTRLTQAMAQLTADMNFFQHLGSQQVVMQAREREVEVEQGTDAYRNQMYWDTISPPEPEPQTLSEDTAMGGEKVTEQTFPCGNILHNKQQYFDHKSFYRMKYLTTDLNHPLAQTIGQPSLNFNQLYSPESSYYRASDSIDESKGRSKIKNLSKRVVVQCESKESIKHKGMHKDSTLSGRFPKLKFSYIHSHQDTLDSSRYSGIGSEEHLPSLSSASLANFGRKGTAGTLRDSVILAHRRISTVSKASLPKKNTFDTSRASLALTHKNSYTIIYNKKLEKVNSGHGSLSQMSAVSQTSNPKHVHSLKNNKNEEYYTALSDSKDGSLSARGQLTSAKNRKFESVSFDVHSKEWNDSLNYDFISRDQSKILDQRKMLISNPSVCDNDNDFSKRSFLNHRNSREIITKRKGSRNVDQTTATQTEESSILPNRD